MVSEGAGMGDGWMERWRVMRNHSTTVARCSPWVAMVQREGDEAWKNSL